jgi:hypothetical protein
MCGFDSRVEIERRDRRSDDRAEVRRSVVESIVEVLICVQLELQSSDIHKIGCKVICTSCITGEQATRLST